MEKEDFSVEINAEKSKISVIDLLDVIKDKHKSCKTFMDLAHTSIVSVNNEYVFDATTTFINNNDEVAIIPPISGG